MNFEQLYFNIEKVWLKINFKKKKKLLNFLKFNYYLLQWKRKKLKLGSIIFEIKEFYLGIFLIYEDIDIRYIKQDNTKTDEMKLENRLKKLKWQWNFDNITAFLIIFFIIIYWNYNFFSNFFPIFFFLNLTNQFYNFLFLNLFKILIENIFIFKNYKYFNLSMFDFLDSYFFFFI